MEKIEIAGTWEMVETSKTFPWEDNRYGSVRDFSRSFFGDGVNYLTWDSIRPVIVKKGEDGSLISAELERSDFHQNDKGRYTTRISDGEHMRLECSVSGIKILAVHWSDKRDLCTFCSRIAVEGDGNDSD